MRQPRSANEGATARQHAIRQRQSTFKELTDLIGWVPEIAADTDLPEVDGTSCTKSAKWFAKEPSRRNNCFNGTGQENGDTLRAPLCGSATTAQPAAEDLHDASESIKS